jgi:hypothetical protein
MRAIKVGKNKKILRSAAERTAKNLLSYRAAGAEHAVLFSRGSSPLRFPLGPVAGIEPFIERNRELNQVQVERRQAPGYKGAMLMEGVARGCLAGLISWKLGGGVISTIIIFLIVFWLLGYVHC